MKRVIACPTPFRMESTEIASFTVQLHGGRFPLCALCDLCGLTTMYYLLSTFPYFPTCIFPHFPISTLPPETFFQASFHLEISTVVWYNAFVSQYRRKQ